MDFKQFLIACVVQATVAVIIVMLKRVSFTGYVTRRGYVRVGGPRTKSEATSKYILLFIIALIPLIGVVLALLALFLDEAKHLEQLKKDGSLVEISK